MILSMLLKVVILALLYVVVMAVIFEYRLYKLKKIHAFNLTDLYKKIQIQEKRSKEVKDNVKKLSYLQNITTEILYEKVGKNLSDSEYLKRKSYYDLRGGYEKYHDTRFFFKDKNTEYSSENNE